MRSLGSLVLILVLFGCVASNPIRCSSALAARGALAPLDGTINCIDDQTRGSPS